jgi:hypothetical protein
MQLNALGIFGGIKAGNKLLWPYESHKNAIITSVVLFVVLFVASTLTLGIVQDVPISDTPVSSTTVPTTTVP